MDPVLQLLSAAGVAGVVVWLFVTDKLTTKKASDERLVENNKNWNERFKDMRDQRDSERARGDEWRSLALGNEQRLDSVTPIVKEAVPLVAAAREAVVLSAPDSGQDLVADHRRADRVRSRRRAR